MQSAARARGQSRQIEVGRMLKLQLIPHQEAAIADISYSTSRVDGEQTEDSPPNIVTTTIQGTQVFTLGSRRLLSTARSGNPTGIIITITEIN